MCIKIKNFYEVKPCKRIQGWHVLKINTPLKINFMKLMKTKLINKMNNKLREETYQLICRITPVLGFKCINLFIAGQHLQTTSTVCKKLLTVRFSIPGKGRQYNFDWWSLKRKQNHILWKLEMRYSSYFLNSGVKMKYLRRWHKQVQERELSTLESWAHVPPTNSTTHITSPEEAGPIKM